MLRSLEGVHLQIREFLVCLWDSDVFQRREEECSTAKQTVRMNEEGKQACYICNRKPISVVQVLQF